MNKKIKILMTFIMFFVVGIIKVNAETFSPEFQILTTDGTITIEYRYFQPYDSLLNSYLGDLNSNNPNYYFSTGECNEDYTVCNIVGTDYITSEDHDITITYKEIFSEEFNKLAPNGILTITETMLENGKTIFLNSTVEKFNNLNNTQFSINFDECNTEYTECKIYGTDLLGYYEEHIVKVVYEEKFSDEFKILTEDGKLTIPIYNEDDKSLDITQYISKFNTDDYTFTMNGCTEDESICNIYLSNSNGNEHHNIKMTYKETFSDTYKKLSSDGTLIINESNTDSYKRNLFDRVINKFNEKNNTNFYLINCDEEYTTCSVELYDSTTGISEKHNLKIKYVDEYSKAYQKLSKDGTIKIISTSLDPIKYNLITNYLYSINNGNTNNDWFNAENCNDEMTLCTISYYQDNVLNEQHTIKIEYKEEYSDIFKKVTTDGKLTIKSSTIGEVNYIVDHEVAKYNYDNYSFYVSECNDEGTVCTIVLTKTNNDNNNTLSFELERHNVKIEYKEEYSDIFKKVTTDGNLVVKSIKPTTMEEAEFFLNSYMSLFDYDKYMFYKGECNDDYTICDIVVGDEYNILETHKVNISYAKLDEKILSKVNELLKNLPKGKRFVVEDLELINYIVNSGYGKSMSVENAIIDYSSEVKKYLGNMNARLDLRAGWDGEFNSGAFGGFLVLYNDTIYGLLESGGAEKNHVIYIPDDTENTKDAFIKAAQERINNYLKNDKVKITYGGSLDEFDEELYKDIVDLSKTRNEYYLLTYDDFEIPFLIAKDSSKIKNEITYETNDIMTDVTISTNSSLVPLDTVIKVDKIKEDSMKYKELVNKLDIDKALVYDLKLYSYTKTEYISKLDDGTFSVSIPLTDDLKNKELVAYYVDDNGKVEEYEIKIIDNKAVFNTNHFSIYTIAEKGNGFNEEVPKTYDSITTYIVLGFVSLTGIISTGIVLKKKFN